jgi:ATP-dependent DNA helicase RecQ
VDERLFETLRELRKQLADKHGVPPFVVFSDATLRELARQRPSSLEKMRRIYGIGDAKMASYGELFLKRIAQYQRIQQSNLDVKKRRTPKDMTTDTCAEQVAVFALFGRGASIDEVVRHCGLTRDIVFELLLDYVRKERPQSLSAWIPPYIYARIEQAVSKVGRGFLRRIREAAGPDIDLDDLRLVLAHIDESTKGS